MTGQSVSDLTRVVPILGMHRSGTSMLAGALQQLGLELGSPLLAATPDNPHGYWENSFFVQINAELLHTMNCDSDGFGSYDALTRLPKLCQRIVVEGHKLAQIGEFVKATFSSPAWGWKDPRTVLTFDVWQRILGELGYRDIRPVILVRHPAGAVRSLVRRVQRNPANQISGDRLTAMATEIWMAYHQILWNRCVNQGWFVATYESFIDPQQAESELTRLAQYCGLHESRIKVAQDSIRPFDAADIRDAFADPRAIKLYNQFQQSALSRPSASASDPVQDTLIKAEPDERRLLLRAEQLRKEGRIDAAVNLLSKGLDIRPQYRAARFMLGTTLMETGHITRSAEHARILIEANPDDPVGHGLRAFGLTQQARIAEAIEGFRECIRCLPNNNAAWSNMLFASLYGDHHHAQDVTRLHQEAGRAVQKNAVGAHQPLGASPQFPGEPDASKFRLMNKNRPLRIGYLSGDLKKHPVGYFLRSILAHHDRTQFDVTCYDIGAVEDELTTILRLTSQHWCNARLMSDDQLLKQIRNDQIDLLIDLSGHSSGNRAGVITRRAAPVQATYIGYPCTTGLPSMDFIISDHHVSPPEFDDLYTERVQRLDNCFLCFHPHDDAPGIALPPYQANGFITFGSFNNLPKISPTTVKLWSDILHAVPDARLAIKALSFVDVGTRHLFHDQFQAHNIDRSRIDLLPPTVPLPKFLDEYRRIDIALDPLPYNGGTTTCEALWMGVPVITLPGQHFLGRMGLSILKTLSLEECIAESTADYVRIAAELASAPERLTQYRSTLRDRLQKSAICDGQRFTRGLETAYRAAMKSAAS